jgi:hypothetical protein
LGLLLNGIGGGSPVFEDVNAGFLAGGGGGGFFPKPPGAGDCDDSDAFDPRAVVESCWLSMLHSSDLSRKRSTGRCGECLLSEELRVYLPMMCLCSVLSLTLRMWTSLQTGFAVH